MTVLLMLAGCPGDRGQTDSEDSEKNRVAVPLKLLVVDDPALAGQIRRQWTARGAGELTVEAVEGDWLQKQRRLSADMIVFPSRLLGTLAAGNRIERWPKDEQGGRSDPDVFPLQRFRETRWGQQPYAVSFGSPQFVLYLRRDRLEELRREVPANWSDYAELVNRLGRSADSGASQPTRFAVAEPLGPGWAARVLLARAATYVGHGSQYSGLFDFTSFEPLIAEPPFVRALEELLAAAELAPPEVLQADPSQVKRWFYEGKVAIAWGWPTGTFSIAKEVPRPIDVVVVEMAPLPGSADAYLFEQNEWVKRTARESPVVPLLAVAGRLGAVVRGTSHRKEAAAALVWLTGREFSVSVSSASPSTTAFRRSHASDPAWLDRGLPHTLAERYGESVDQTQSLAHCLFVPRIPGGDRYLSVLDEAVRRAVKDGVDPQVCLKQVAEDWANITREFGRDRQVQAYHQSLGLER